MIEGNVYPSARSILESKEMNLLVRLTVRSLIVHLCMRVCGMARASIILVKLLDSGFHMSPRS